MIDPAAAELIRDLAACRTFEELCGYDRDEPHPEVQPSYFDELIERARDLVDTLGLHTESDV